VRRLGTSAEYVVASEREASLRAAVATTIHACPLNAHVDRNRRDGRSPHPFYFGFNTPPPLGEGHATRKAWHAGGGNRIREYGKTSGCDAPGAVFHLSFTLSVV
jgi:hypothetical protein